MSTASGKSKPRRLMRAATIFTGVAGVATTTVGLTQPANAQDAGRKVSGSIRYDVNCGHAGVDRTWLHVSTTTSGGYGPQGQSVCFGYKGLYSSPPLTGMYGYCGGNNYGWINGSKNGTYVIVDFGPGTTYRAVSWSHYDNVAITHWAGSDKCPQAPYWGQPMP
jgi:hypothetical protein